MEVGILQKLHQVAAIGAMNKADTWKLHINAPVLVYQFGGLLDGVGRIREVLQRVAKHDQVSFPMRTQGIDTSVFQNKTGRPASIQVRTAGIASKSTPRRFLERDEGSSGTATDIEEGSTIGEMELDEFQRFLPSLDLVLEKLFRGNVIAAVNSAVVVIVK